GLDECDTQPGVALTRLATQPFASALFVTRTHPRPRRKMGRVWKTRHISPDLGQQYLGRATAHAWNPVQSFDLFFNRAYPLRHFDAQPSDGLIQEIDVCQLLSYQEALMRSKAARQRLFQLCEL